MGAFALLAGAAAVFSAAKIDQEFSVALRSPVQLLFRSPLVVSRRVDTPITRQVRREQHSPLTTFQQYTCEKFGPACHTALAIQRAENPTGQCEIYHSNSDGSLDWGYFQINTVHLKRPDVNLRDLLDCKANIDFAYKLYTENHGFGAWSTFRSGAYRRGTRELALRN